MVLDKQNRSILIIDDDRAILNVFSRIFEKNEYTVTTVESARDAEEKLCRQDYDAVLVDVRLSGMNGVDLLLQMHRRAPQMVKIVITGSPTSEAASKAAKYGADAFLTKPVDPTILLEILKKKLAEKRTHFCLQPTELYA